MLGKYFDKYKNDIKKAIDDLKHKDRFYKQIPNLLTFMRLVLALPAGLLYYVNPTVSLFGIAILWLTDAIDGKIARKFELQSKLGADMDTVADKIMFLASAIPLLSATPFLGVNLLLEGVISAINVAGRIKGLNTKTVLSGKIKTISMALTLIFGYLTKIIGLSEIYKILVGMTTVLQGVAIKDYISEFIKMDNEKKDNVVVEQEKHDNNELLNDEEMQEKTLVPEVEISMSEQLKNLKTFVLSSQQPDKVYSGKKRVRILLQEKKNS